MFKKADKNIVNQNIDLDLKDSSDVVSTVQSTNEDTCDEINVQDLFLKQNSINGEIAEKFISITEENKQLRKKNRDAEQYNKSLSNDVGKRNEELEEQNRNMERIKEKISHFEKFAINKVMEEIITPLTNLSNLGQTSEENVRENLNQLLEQLFDKFYSLGIMINKHHTGESIKGNETDIICVDDNNNKVDYSESNLKVKKTIKLGVQFQDEFFEKAKIKEKILV